MRRIHRFLGDAWRLAGPYWRSDERWRGLALLGTLIALNLMLVGINVLLSYWSREFFNTLQGKDLDAFNNLLFWYAETDSGLMPGFVFIAAIYILIAVYQLYLRQALQIRWRSWMTRDYLGRWLADRAYYRIGLAEGSPAAGFGTDNPDQRIADDIRMFVDDTLTLGLGLMRSVVTLVSFIFVLWGLSGALTVWGIEIPGYLVWVALVYSVLGTALAHWIGRPLIGLNFQQQKVEADFRFALVRVRENAEGIALHGGEAPERAGLLDRFGALMRNWWAIMVATKRLTFFTAGFGQVATVFPYVVAAPAYFAGRVPLGALTQTTSAFSEVQGAFSWFVDSYRSLTDWRATVQRLTGFMDAVAGARAATATDTGVQVAAAGTDLVLEDVALGLPDGRPLMSGVAARVAPGERLVVGGPSGSGKSTLFRAIAGIWPFGRGRISIPAGARVLFLPQRPYLPLGSLRQAVCYPGEAADYSEAAVQAALADAGLGALADRLDAVERWDKKLSGGEQQRLGLARALLNRPEWLFLDEATASLDPAAERQFYETLRARLPGTTLVSIAHRPSVAEFHERALRVEGGRLVAVGQE